MTDYAKSRATASTQGRVSRIQQTVRHDKYNNKCVCDICTCGNCACHVGGHRCPPTQRRKFEGHTTNQDFYHPYKIQPDRQPPAQYKISQRRYDPEQLQTTYNVQYTPKRASRMETDPEQIQRSIQFVRNKAPFYSDTQYNVKYVPKQLTPERVPDATYQYRPNPARFQGVTSYNAEFTPKRSAVVEPQHPNPEMVYERKKIPFQGQSSYNQQFQPYHITPAKPESEYKYRPNTAKFNGTTRYNEDYHPYKQSAYRDAIANCPIYELPPYPPECSPGKRHLNYSAEKNYWQ